ncbi:MAG: gluconate 2-dehydrogenase subunit 3 family protein [Balneolaceae bacterium]|nr:gluconate 2-dehydrogenase subunit 3 family protein [Balneolaceae bacterium]
MDRREHLKLLLAGTVGTGLFITSCTKEDRQISEKIIERGAGFGYGRTEEEKKRDNRLHSETFFTDYEMEMVHLLADIIIPADEESGSATDAGVPDFIEFMMKDIPALQVPTRGGLMWLNIECRKRFNKTFLQCSDTEKMQLIDEIAWPDKASADMLYGVRFFNRMRDLVSTGYFTSRQGIEYLGYEGNSPGFWDGVPDEVLKKHGFEYDQKTLDECIKAEDRYRIAEWDDEANLL